MRVQWRSRGHFLFRGRIGGRTRAMGLTEMVCVALPRSVVAFTARAQPRFCDFIVFEVGLNVGLK